MTDARTRNQLIIASYQRGKTVREVALEFGVTSRAVDMILRAEEVPRHHLQQRRPLSERHRHIGKLLAEALFDRGHHERSMAAAALGWHTSKLNRVLHGQTDLNLNDLETLSKYTGKSYEVLMTPPQPRSTS